MATMELSELISIADAAEMAKKLVEEIRAMPEADGISTLEIEEQVEGVIDELFVDIPDAVEILEDLKSVRY